MFGLCRLLTMDMITSELFGWFRMITTLYLADGEMMRFWLLLVKSIINQVMQKLTDHSKNKHTDADLLHALCVPPGGMELFTGNIRKQKAFASLVRQQKGSW